MAVPTSGTVTAKSIVVSWTTLTSDADMGGDTIINYKLQYNENLATSTWSDVVTLGPTVTTYTHTLTTNFPANADRTDHNVKYRVVAANNVGWGIESDPLEVLTDTYPKQMNAPQLDGIITPASFKIKWDVLSQADATHTGRDPLINYQFEWLKVTDPLTTTWQVLTSTSDIATSSHEVTSGFEINTTYRFRIAAINEVGLGPYSDILEILTDNVPVRMNDPVEDPTTNATYIKVTWAPITDDADTGRDAVTYYKLEWDQGTGTWVELTDGTTVVYEWVQSHDLDGIQNGTAYKYRITPKNNAGFGATSIEKTIIPSSPPDRMPTVVTSISGTNVVIDWSNNLPQNNGAAISSYQVQIKAKNGTFLFENTSCDGTGPAIVAAKQCQIPMATLRAAPFNLVKSDLIEVKINAANLKGYNASFSAPNTAGATVEDVPVAPGAPSRDNSATTYNYMRVTFSGLTDGQPNAGGATCQIQSYHVQRDQGNNTSSALPDEWTDIKGLSTLDTATWAATSSGIVGGTTYKVRVRALNKHGWGPWSSTTNIRCAKAPLAPPSVTTTNTTVYVKVNWDVPTNNNGLTITKYLVEFQKKAGAWSTILGECDGSNTVIFAARECSVLMSTLVNSFSLVYNDVVNVRVSAYNLEGYSSTKSNSGGATIQTEPVAPTVAITNVVANTNDY